MTALLLSLSLLMAQEIPAGVITAFKRGSSQELSKYMGDKAVSYTHLDVYKRQSYQFEE